MGAAELKPAYSRHTYLYRSLQLPACPCVRLLRSPDQSDGDISRPGAGSTALLLCTVLSVPSDIVISLGESFECKRRPCQPPRTAPPCSGHSACAGGSCSTASLLKYAHALPAVSTCHSIFHGNMPTRHRSSSVMKTQGVHMTLYIRNGSGSDTRRVWCRCTAP